MLKGSGFLAGFFLMIPTCALRSFLALFPTMHPFVSLPMAEPTSYTDVSTTMDEVSFRRITAYELRQHARAA